MIQWEFLGEHTIPSVTRVEAQEFIHAFTEPALRIKERNETYRKLEG